MLRALLEAGHRAGPGGRHVGRRGERRGRRRDAVRGGRRAAGRAVARPGLQRPVRAAPCSAGCGRWPGPGPACTPTSRCGSCWTGTCRCARSPSSRCRSSAWRRASSGPRSTGSPPGSLTDAVLASCAVPGLLPPVEVGRRDVPGRRAGAQHPGRPRGRPRRPDRVRAAGRPDRAPAAPAAAAVGGRAGRLRGGPAAPFRRRHGVAAAGGDGARAAHRAAGGRGRPAQPAALPGQLPGSATGWTARTPPAPRTWTSESRRCAEPAAAAAGWLRAGAHSCRSCSPRCRC